MPKLTKVVIPVAGLGTRTLPASKAIPKEMLTVVDKPAIQHVVEEAVAAGFTEIILVTRSGKSAIADHFDSHSELEQILESKGKLEILASIRRLLPHGVSLCAIRQPEPKGLGDAVRCAAPLVGKEAFAVMLPDMLIHHPSNVNSTDLRGMLARYHHQNSPQVMVEAVAEANVVHYGIIATSQPSQSSWPQTLKIKQIVEKPSHQDAPSNLAVMGRYILPPEIFAILENTPPGAGDEIQLTDAIAQLLKSTTTEAYLMQGKTYDCGNKQGLLRANLIFGLNHISEGQDFRAFVSDIISQSGGE